jgi:hypothetical protein
MLGGDTVGQVTAGSVYVRWDWRWESGGKLMGRWLKLDLPFDNDWQDCRESGSSSPLSSAID